MQKRQKPSNEANLKKYRTAMLELLRMKQPRASLTGPELNPRPISLSPEARNLWVAFADECERELAAGQKLEPVRAFANKLAAQALRDRKSVVEGKSVSVRVDLGVRRIIKK